MESTFEFTVKAGKNKINLVLNATKYSWSIEEKETFAIIADGFYSGSEVVAHVTVKYQLFYDELKSIVQKHAKKNKFLPKF